MKKILRVSTALFLCFVMLLYTGPMQVAASGLAGTLYQIAGNIGVNAALRAIGVGPGNSPDVFNTLVTNISDALAPASNFMTDVLIAGTSGNWLTFLRDTFVQSILDYAFNNGVLKTSIDFLPSRYHSEYEEALSSFISSFGYTPYVCIAKFDNTSYPYRIYFGQYPFSYDTSSERIVCLNGSEQISFKRYDVSSSGSITAQAGTTSSGWPGVECVYFYSGSGVSTDEDLTLDTISPSLNDDPYIPWVENSISNNGATFVPVSLPSLDSSVVSSQTQVQAQAGTATDAVVDEIIAGSDVVPDTGTGTIADVIAAIKAIPLSLADFFADVVAAVQAIPAAIADIFSPAADPEVYQVDLKDFFPFCIPFDLFDIVTAFAAEPEAPVFEWPISVPRWGFEYTLKVDLQEWEDIASLFRTLELTVFCVGLAIVTREKFLRS